jgi:uncharacterized peroxidase-related enzyme
MQSGAMFAEHTVESAPEASRGALAAAGRQFGFVPSAMARMAESPSVVEAFGRMMAIWDRSSLAEREREVVVLTVAHDNGCEVCVAIHSAILQRESGDAALVGALRQQTPLADACLEALRLFTREVMELRGAVPEARLARFLAAGFSRQQALDVVLGVATYALSTYANRLTGAPLDAPFEPFRWSRPV